MPDAKDPRNDLLPGTLDLLILRTLASGPIHGWGISQRIQSVSRDVLVVNQGSLYPALYRLEHRGVIESGWGESENKRKARYYRLTAAGRKRFKEEVAYWQQLSDAIGIALKAAPEDV
jgi:transcriptional regulator